MKKTPFHYAYLISAAFLCCFTGTAWGGGPMRGPLPAEQREIIQFMAEHHEELTREVKLREDGYEATTTTKNEILARKLKQHFAYMEERIGSGAMVRRWDPAFAELIQFQDQIQTKVEYLENGLKVVVTSQTPEGIQVAQNHARIVTGFTEEGAKAVSRKHEAVLDDGE
jgi:hypothetical protein